MTGEEAKREEPKRKDTVAIVWDIENVTPSINSTFIKGLLGYVRNEGRPAVSRVYGDWSKESLSSTARQLHEENFDLIQLPKEAGVEREYIIVGKTVDLINVYPNINKLVLITGDSTFIRLIKDIAAHDVETQVICDAKNADEELLLRAETYKDFRDLTILPIEEPSSEEKEPHLSLEESFVLLREAILHIENRDKLPTVESVKVRLKLMNERFDEANFGFDSWHDYLAEAERRDYVYIRFREQNLVVSNQRMEGKHGRCRPSFIIEFLSALEESETVRTSEGSKAKLFDIGRRLAERGIDYRDHGYSRLKKVADASAKRGLVNISLRESNYLLSLTKRGHEYLTQGEK